MCDSLISETNLVRISLFPLLQSIDYGMGIIEESIVYDLSIGISFFVGKSSTVKYTQLFENGGFSGVFEPCK